VIESAFYTFFCEIDSQCAVESTGDFGHDSESIVEHNQVLRLASAEETSVSHLYTNIFKERSFSSVAAN